MTNGIIHYMIVKRYLEFHNRLDLWNTIYYCAEFVDRDYITIHSLYDISHSVDIDTEDEPFFKDLVLHILFECADNIIY